MTLLNPKKSLLDTLLEGKSELEKSKVREIIAWTQIEEDDPAFILIACSGFIQAAVEEIPKDLALERQQLTQELTKLDTQVKTLSDLTSSLLTATENLNDRLKGQVPRAARNSGLLIRELAITALIALIAGTLFGHPLLGLMLSSTCHQVPHLCEVEP